MSGAVCCPLPGSGSLSVLHVMPGTGRHWETLTHAQCGAAHFVRGLQLSSVAGLPCLDCGELKMDCALPVTFSKAVAAVPFP